VPAAAARLALQRRLLLLHHLLEIQRNLGPAVLASRACQEDAAKPRQEQRN
jgi:hypothetical protein